MPGMRPVSSTSGSGGAPAAHSAEAHTDITRSLWVPARPNMVTDGSTTGSKGTLPDSAPTLTLADAATQGAYFVWNVPKDAKAASPLSIEIRWAAGAAVVSSTSVVWSIDALVVADGAAISAAGTTVQFTGVAAVRADGEYEKETSTQILASVSADDLVRIDVRRLGADAADNFTATAHLVGVLLSYTATQ